MGGCHSPVGSASQGAVDLAQAKKIVLVGNPNVGKSVVFGALSGIYADVSNFPGTTVELKRTQLTLDNPATGKPVVLELIDSPGVYGVSALSDEERITRDIVLEADVVINVVNSTQLERDLFLTAQLLDMGIPMIVAANMTDEAAAAGVNINFDLLEDLLGVHVIPLVATHHTGIDELKRAIPDAHRGHAEHALKHELQLSTLPEGITQGEMLMLLEGDADTAERLTKASVLTEDEIPSSQQESIYTQRRLRVNDIIGHVVTQSARGASIKTKISMAMMHPLTGLPMLAGVLWIIWVVIGQWVGGTVVDFIEGGIMQAYWVPLVESVVKAVGISIGSIPHTFLAGEFGVLTMVPTYLIGVIFPLVVGFYLLLAILEDSGYLPRIAVLTDRALSLVGLNGRAIIPLILGLGCITMGTLTTRVLNSPRERKIATALMAIAIPCSAQLAVIAALMGSTPVVYSAIYLTFLVLVFGVVGAGLAWLTPGQSTDLLIDLPNLRLPSLKNVMQKTALKVWDFMKEVTLFFVIGSLFISIMRVTGALDWTIQAAAPLVTGWMGLPAEAATAFIMGFIRRDFGAAGFFDMNLTSAQLLVGMSAITLFVPCIASAVVILKERGIGYFIALFVFSTGLAFGLGGIMWQLLQYVGLA